MKKELTLEERLHRSNWKKTFILSFTFLAVGGSLFTVNKELPDRVYLEVRHQQLTENRQLWVDRAKEQEETLEAQGIQIKTLNELLQKETMKGVKDKEAIKTYLSRIEELRGNVSHWQKEALNAKEELQAKPKERIVYRDREKVVYKEKTRGSGWRSDSGKVVTVEAGKGFIRVNGKTYALNGYQGSGRYLYKRGDAYLTINNHEATKANVLEFNGEVYTKG